MTTARKPHPIATHIRDLRREQGISLAALANRTGIPAAVIGSYERGGRRTNLDSADRILAALDGQLAVIPRGMDMEALLAELVTLRQFASHIRDLLATGQLHTPDSATPGRHLRAMAS